MASLKIFALLYSLAWQLISAQDLCPGLKLNTGLAPLLGNLPISNCAPDLPGLPGLLGGTDLPCFPPLPTLSAPPDCVNFPPLPASDDSFSSPYLSELPSTPNIPCLPNVPTLSGSPDCANLPCLPAIDDSVSSPCLSELPSIPNIPCLPDIPYLPSLPGPGDWDGFSGFGGFDSFPDCSFKQPFPSYQNKFGKGCLANKKPCCLNKGEAPQLSYKIQLKPIKKCGLKNLKCDYPVDDCYY